jgi:hypothetical protein
MCLLWIFSFPIHFFIPCLFFRQLTAIGLLTLPSQSGNVPFLRMAANTRSIGKIDPGIQVIPSLSYHLSSSFLFQPFLPFIDGKMLRKSDGFRFVVGLSEGLSTGMVSFSFVSFTFPVGCGPFH